MLKIDLSKEENLLALDSIKLGAGAASVCNKATTTQAPEVRAFRKNAQTFLLTLVEKLKERSPLRYKLTMYIASLSPFQIASASSQLMIDLFEKLCLHLVDAKWISTLCADRAETSYSTFISSMDVKQKLKEFTIDMKLDSLYMELLKNHVELRVVKIIMILSHGQGRVESGFSVNEDSLAHNMKEDTLVANRMVYDGIRNEGGIFKVDINKEMLKFCRTARSAYQNALEENRKQQTAGEKRKQDRREIQHKISAAKKVKEACVVESTRKNSELDSRIFSSRKN